jgi:hypothetical protein
MAFNPFTSFRKYQKFWMAMLVLLSMVTFVLCSGIGSGGLEDWLLRVFGGSRGSQVATVYGHGLYTRDLQELKKKRNIANDYMHRAMEISKKGLELVLKENAKVQNQKERLRVERILRAQYQDLVEQERRPRYFGGGDKLDDLIDFYLWQQQADKLGIQLEDKQIHNEIAYTVYAGNSRMMARNWQDVAAAVSSDHGNVSLRDITEALRQEYRVQAAKMALLKSRPYAFMKQESLELLRRVERRKAPSPQELWEFYVKNRTSADIALIPVSADKFLAKVKEPDRQLLEKLFEDYKNIKYDPASPVPGFIAPEEVKVTWVTADPHSKYYHNLAQVAMTLDRTPLVAWTPALPGLGAALEYAGRSVAWRAALQADYVKRREQLLNKLPPQLRPALKGLDYEGRDELLNYALRTMALDAKEANELLFYLDEALTEPYTALSLATRLYDRKPDPQVVAAAVGAATLPGALSPAPALFQAAAWQQHGKEAAPFARKEEERRWPIGMTLILSAASPMSPLQTLGMWNRVQEEEQFLPLELVAAKFRRAAEDRLAIGWTNQVMRTIRPKLEEHRSSGRDMELELDELQQEYPGLEVHRTSQFHTRFDIAKDPEMRRFLDSFEKYRDQVNLIEGRAGTERALKEDSFYTLFFGGEPYSVGNTAKYDPRLWPPIVTPAPKRMGLDQANKLLLPVGGGAANRPREDLWLSAAAPIIFWKTETKTEQAPHDLAEVQNAVDRAWKLAQAREKFALPEAKKIAETLRKAQPKDGNYEGVMEQEAAKLGTHMIVLRGVTPLVPDLRGELAPASWKPYQLPKDMILYPTDDTTKELLALRLLKEPIKIKPAEQKTEKTALDVPAVVKALNDTNKALIKLPGAAKGAPQVQILTNRPRTVFYVAAVLKENPPDQIDFIVKWSDAVKSRGPGAPLYLDTIIDRAQEEFGKEFEQRFVQQLRAQAGLKIEESARKDFESGG